MRLVLGFFALLTGAAAAQPACTAPAGPLQSVICAEPGLREAEQRLRGLEGLLAASTTRPATTQHRAAAWLRRWAEGEPGTGRPFTPETLRPHLDERMGELEESLRQDRAMPRQAMARPPALDRLCLGTALRNCRVAATGLVLSEDGRTRILWQSQRGFTDQDGTRAGIVLLAEQRGGWRPIAWAFEAVSYGAPSLIQQEGGLLLAVPGRMGGSGGGNAELLYQSTPGGWREVNLESWQSALATQLPPGLGVMRGVAYDFERLSARTRLWRDADGNCCPTGGSARLDFRIEGHALVLAEVRMDATAPPVSCPAERATYRLNAPLGFASELRREGRGTGSASDLLLRVHSEASGRDYWFRFAASQGYGGLSLLPVAAPGPATAEDGILDLDLNDDVLPLLRIFPMAEDLTVLDDAPVSGRPAPRHLFAPGLGQALHYGELPQQAATPGASEAMPLAVWTLHACRP